MQNTKRILQLDICDYDKHVICSLYDSESDISGQAVDVYNSIERNGWKELSFSIPSVCVSENGHETNYRLDFLKADYQIRAIDDYETDWFIISEPQITHNAYSKKINVVARHVSQLLKFKNLGLEFSDNQGNNVGTAQQFAEIILNGTGWKVGYVYPFAEKDGSTKYRTLRASAKTGAFKLMSIMCDLFDAKPIYHGDTRTVDIVPINPFSEPDPGKLPDVFLTSKEEDQKLAASMAVIELHYGNNVSNVRRKLNTDNLVTKMYAYGSYGDKTSGYCGIDECSHIEYVFTLNSDCIKGNVYNFTVIDRNNISQTYYFKCTTDVSAGSVFVFSLLDPSSMLYIWDESNHLAYPVKKGTYGETLPSGEGVAVEAQNWFQFVMNYDYYRRIGLFTDRMIQQLAEYQRAAPSLYEEVASAAKRMSDAQTVLSENIGNIHFCKLNIDREEILLGDGYSTLILKKDSSFPDGVIYRSDYDQHPDNYFEWNTTDSLNSNGDPINSAASVLYVIHAPTSTSPITWDKAYLKAIDNEDNPYALTLWAETGSLNINIETDQFFLFAYNGINGYLGALEANDESAVMTLKEAVKVVTVDHPVFFTDKIASTQSTDSINEYGWLWRYDPYGSKSTMYFCNKNTGDTGWNQVYFQDTNPFGEEGSYWYDWRNSKLFNVKNNELYLYETAAEKRLAALFPTVYMLCKNRDRYYQGLSSTYTYTVPDNTTLIAGNYYIENEYNSYWTFTTTQPLSSKDTLTYDYLDGVVKQTAGGVETTLAPKGYRFDNVKYHVSNVLNSTALEEGYISSANGTLEDNENKSRMQTCVSVIPNTSYTISGAQRLLYVHMYDDNQRWLSCTSTSIQFTTSGACKFIRICSDSALNDFYEYNNIAIFAANSDNTIIIEDLNYIKLSSEHIVADDFYIGLIDCMERFNEYSALTHDVYYQELKNAQAAITQLDCKLMETIGDLYREGWWHDASYVDGDEKKLYEDALDNLKEVSKPEATYDVTYLDLYSSNENNCDYGAYDATIKTKWPDISILSAVHLVDPEIAINCWAYVDKVKKCYDKPWQTNIVINTKLSTISQHSFTDVMTNIADVANEMKGKTSYYDKTLSGSADINMVAKLSANIIATEKDLSSAYSKVEQIGDTLITHSSRIDQTIDSIVVEVNRATDKEKSISSKVKIAADNITSIVEMKNENAYAGSALKQTIDGINTQVTGKNPDGSVASSSLKQTVDSISTQVTGKNPDGSTPSTSTLYQDVRSIVGAVEDYTGKSVSEITADHIKLAVQSQNADAQAGNEFSTSSVTINNNGVAVSTGGNVSIAAGGTFTVDSGKFDVDENGKMTATEAFLSGTVYSEGFPVMKSGYDIVVSTTQPNGHAGMLWIKPGVPVSDDPGGTTEEETSATVSYSCYIPWDSRSYVGSSADNSNATGVLTGSGVSFAASSCTYTAQVPVYLQTNSTSKTGGRLCLRLSDGINSVTLTGTVTQEGGAYQIISLSGTSSQWIGSTSTLSFAIYAESISGYSRGNILRSRDNSLQIIVSCYGTK